MKAKYLSWMSSATASFEGRDYPEGKVFEDEVEPHFWRDDQRYKPFLDEWRNRWEYRKYTRPPVRKKR
jgi:hypothetical protein